MGDTETNYLSHLLMWMLPVIAIQWVIAWRIFMRNLRAVLLPPLIVGLYYSLTDLVAIHEGIWFFDESQTLGIKLGVVPVEEVLFFFITALIVAQSLVMLLPERLRRGNVEE
jgi:lycopene cyclase domain-containing protein